jgi:hypothetical protein
MVQAPRGTSTEVLAGLVECVTFHNPQNGTQAGAPRQQARAHQAQTPILNELEKKC